ncbi:monocarboxylate transporter 9-like [Lineus longissimus]|uniref:monocarboxylate transporter 9-like n=1 Tax=Lineus longissimus TaxID=88925 RepID=UPI002B4CA82F
MSIPDTVTRDENQKRPSAPDGGWGWMVVLGCALVHVLITGLATSYGLIYQYLIERFGGSAALTASIHGVSSALRFGLGPVASTAVNRISTRKVVIIGSFVVSVGVILCAFPPNVEYMFLTWTVLVGGGGCFVIIPSIIHVGLHFNKRRAVANGISTAGAGVGQFVFPLVFVFLQENYGYFGAMLIMGGLSLNLVVAGVLYRPLENKEVAVEEKTVFLPNASDDSNTAQSVTCDKDLVDEGGESNLIEASQIDSQKTTSLLENTLSLHKNDEAQNFISQSDSENIYKSDSDLETTANCGNDLKTTELCSNEIDSDIEISKTCRSSSDVKNSPSDSKEQNFKISCSSSNEGDSHSNRCTKVCCSSKSKSGKKIVDFRLLKEPSFFFFSLCLAFCTMGYMLIRTFIPALVESRGHPKALSAQLLAYSGGADMCGRLSAGFFFDMKRIRPVRRYLYNALPFIISIIVGVFPSAQEPGEYICISILFGFFIGTYVAQRPSILADLVGNDRFSDALGLAMFFNGGGLLIGPSVGGALRDMTGYYDPAYYFGSCCLAVGGSIFLCQNIMFIRQQRRMMELPSVKDAVTEVSV